MSDTYLFEPPIGGPKSEKRKQIKDVQDAIFEVNETTRRPAASRKIEPVQAIKPEEKLQETTRTAETEIERSSTVLATENKSIVARDGRISSSVNQIILTAVHYCGTVSLAIFDAILFWGLAGDSVPLKILLAFVAVLFSVGEVALWDMGGKINRACAIGLALFSLIAATSVSLHDIASYRASGIDDLTLSSSAKLSAIGKQEEVILERLKNMPADFATRSETLIKELDSLTAKKAAITARLEDAKKSAAKDERNIEIFVLLSRLFGVELGTLSLVFLIFRSLMLQVVTLATGRKDESKQSNK